MTSHYWVDLIAGPHLGKVALDTWENAAAIQNWKVTNSKSSKTWSGIGGAIVTAILTVYIVTFICIFLYEYRKGCPPYFPTFVRSLLITTGSLLTAQNGTPIHIGEVAKNAFFTTLTLGLAGICSPKRVEFIYLTCFTFCSSAQQLLSVVARTAKTSAAALISKERAPLPAIETAGPFTTAKISHLLLWEYLRKCLMLNWLKFGYGEWLGDSQLTGVT